MKTNTHKIQIPVYKTGCWTDEVAYLICSTKIIDVKIPKNIMIGFDSVKVMTENCFSINLN